MRSHKHQRPAFAPRSLRVRSAPCSGFKRLQAHAVAQAEGTTRPAGVDQPGVHVVLGHPGTGHAATPECVDMSPRV